MAYGWVTTSVFYVYDRNNGVKLLVTFPILDMQQALISFDWCLLFFRYS